MKRDIPVDLRLGVPFDEDPLMLLLDEMLGEEAVDPVDEPKLRLTLRGLLNRRGGVVGVMRGENGIEGTIGLALEQVFYSSAYRLSKLWLYVPPAHRQSTHAKTMILFSKMYSDRLGVPLISEEIFWPNTERRIELIERQMPSLGRLFLYNQRQREPDQVQVA